MIVLEFEPIWVIIFFTTLGLSILCLHFGISLIRRNPRGTPTTALGGFFLGQFIIFFTFPYIMLNPSFAIWSYKVQVLGFQVSTVFTATLAQSFTRKITSKFCILVVIPAITISLITWILTPFSPLLVAYGYELDIQMWFFMILGIYGFPPLIYLVIELSKIYRNSEQAIRHRILILIVSYVSLVSSMTLLFTILPIMLERPEVKPIGILISTICVIGIYYGYRRRNQDGP